VQLYHEGPADQGPWSDFYDSTIFAIELPRQRIKIGVPHSDFYSSCERTYNKRVTDEVNALKIIFDIQGHEYQESCRSMVRQAHHDRLGLPLVQLVQGCAPFKTFEGLKTRRETSTFRNSGNVEMNAGYRLP